MCLGTFSRRARSLATFFIFVRVRISGTQCLLFHRKFLRNFLWNKKEPGEIPWFSSFFLESQFFIHQNHFYSVWNMAESCNQCLTADTFRRFTVGTDTCLRTRKSFKTLSVNRSCHILCTGICLSLIHIWRCRRSTLCRSRGSPYH